MTIVYHFAHVVAEEVAVDDDGHGADDEAHDGHVGEAEEEEEHEAAGRHDPEEGRQTVLRGVRPQRLEEEHHCHRGEQAQPVEHEVVARRPAVPRAEVAPRVRREDREQAVDHVVDGCVSDCSNESGDQEQDDRNDSGEESYSPVSVNSVAQSVVLSHPDAPQQGHQYLNNDQEVELSEEDEVLLPFFKG